MNYAEQLERENRAFRIVSVIFIILTATFLISFLVTRMNSQYWKEETAKYEQFYDIALEDIEEAEDYIDYLEYSMIPFESLIELGRDYELFDPITETTEIVRPVEVFDEEDTTMIGYLLLDENGEVYDQDSRNAREFVTFCKQLFEVWDVAAG